MNILILNAEPECYSTRRLVEEIQKKGEDYEVISPSDLYAYISNTVSGHDRVYRKTDKESERILSKTFDAVIPRVSGGLFEHSIMILKQLNENMRIFSTSCEAGLKACANKFLTSQILSANQIRSPKQIVAHKIQDYKELIDMVGGLPCVGKLQRGSMGEGVFILNDELAASTSLKSFEKTGTSVILQQFIETGTPRNDLRIIVIGPEKKKPKIFAYKRFALDSDFRSNYSISKSGEKVEITEDEKEMAIKACQVLGLGVAGVDIMRDAEDENKPYMIEVNGNPGLAGVESVTGDNIAGAIIEYVLDNYKRGGKPRMLTDERMPVTANDALWFSFNHRKVYNHLMEGKEVELIKERRKPVIVKSDGKKVVIGSGRR